MGVALSLGLGILQAGAQYQQGRQQAAAYEMQAQQDDMNARITERQRVEENVRSLDERKRILARAETIAGQNRAAFGAGGIDSASGTATALQIANQETLNEDLAMNRYNLGLADTGLRQNIANLNYSAQANRSAARSAKKSAAAGSILSLATSIVGVTGAKAADKTLTGSGGNSPYTWSKYTSTPQYDYLKNVTSGGSGFTFKPKYNL